MTIVGYDSNVSDVRRGSVEEARDWSESFALFRVDEDDGTFVITMLRRGTEVAQPQVSVSSVKDAVNGRRQTPRTSRVLRSIHRG